MDKRPKKYGGGVDKDRDEEQRGVDRKDEPLERPGRGGRASEAEVWEREQSQDGESAYEPEPERLDAPD